jgi:hypothetical protein
MIQNLLACLTAACCNWGSHSEVYLMSLSSPVPMTFLFSSPSWFPKTFHVFCNVKEFALTPVSRGGFKNSTVICLIYSMICLKKSTARGKSEIWGTCCTTTEAEGVNEIRHSIHKAFLPRLSGQLAGKSHKIYRQGSGAVKMEKLGIGRT